MNTLRALALIRRAVELSEAGFRGDALAEVCRFASEQERQAVQCIVQSRPAFFGHKPTAQEVMAALRDMVRGEAARQDSAAGVHRLAALSAPASERSTPDRSLESLTGRRRHVHGRGS